MSRKKRSPEPKKRYLGRAMESSWLITESFLDRTVVAHAFRYYGPGEGYAKLSECKQSQRGMDAVWAPSRPTLRFPNVSRCERCSAIMALPGMMERNRDG